MGKIKCGNCGCVFDEDEIRWEEEYRGEFWGMPAYESMAGCPACGDYDIYDIDDEEDEDD